MAYEMTLAANALAIENADQKDSRSGRESKKSGYSKIASQGKLSIEDIADANDVAIDVVLDVQRNL